MRHSRTGGFALSVVLGSAALHAQSVPVPAGPQFQVNTFTTLYQFHPAIAVDASGAFVVVWQNGFLNEGDIEGQRYSASGAAAGGQFPVASYTSYKQEEAAIAMDAAGNFVVVWTSSGSSGSDTSFHSIQAQRFAASGAPDGDQFQVNSYTTSFQHYPAVASEANGDFVVVWESFGSSASDTSGASVHGQRYLADGAPAGGEFQVNSYTSSTQGNPALALDAAGDFVVLWDSDGSGGDDTSIFSVQGQRYQADGSAAGSQFQVNSYSWSDQIFPAVASTAAGELMVAWQSYGSNGDDASFWSVQGQRYSPGGLPAGGEFQVNSYTPDYQRLPAITVDPDGDYIVVWTSGYWLPGNGSTESVQGQRFLAGGAPAGGQFQINSLDANLNGDPTVAADANGDFVVAWASDASSGSDTSFLSVQGRRFRVTGDLQGRVFSDRDADGIQGVSEPGIAGVEVELYDESHVRRRSALTDGGGNYLLKPKEGNWTLRFVPPSDRYDFTAQDAGGDDTLDSDADPLTGETALFDVAILDFDDTLDAGFLTGIFNDGFGSHDTSAWSAAFP